MVAIGARMRAGDSMCELRRGGFAAWNIARAIGNYR